MKKIIASLVLTFFASILFANNADLSFIQNNNQWDAHVKYKVDINGGHVFLSNQFLRFAYYNTRDLETIHELKHTDAKKAYQANVDCYAYDLQFVHANPQANIVAQHQKSNYYNYFLGNDASKWAGGVPCFAGVDYTNLFTNIDANFYSVGTSLKYDFVVHVGGDANDIQLQYKGIQPQLTKKGTLLFDIGFTRIQESAPYTYQIIDGKKTDVLCEYKMNAQGIISFALPNEYNKNYDLIIDPVLVFSTYSGGTNSSFGFSATYDLAGSLYSGGEAFGIGWPTSTGAYQSTFGGGVDCGINKYTPTGNALIYSTYFGGSSSDLPNNMVVNANNELAMTGSTTSSNLPTTTGCYDNSQNGSDDLYVVHFNATGTALIGSTYVGGNGSDGSNVLTLSPNYGDGNRGEIFFDVNDELVVAGSTESSNFPTTIGAYQTTIGGLQDGCVFKLNSNCSSLLFSTFLGGSAQDACFSIVKNSANQWVVTGGTLSTNFPTTAGVAQSANAGLADAFISILNIGATSLVASTYYGTSVFDHGYKIQIDLLDTIYVCGQTNDPAFPISAGVYSNAGGNITFTKFTPNLSAMVRSTIIGESSTTLIPSAFMKDVCGNVYVSAYTFGMSANMPLSSNAFQSTVGGFWLCVLTGDFNNMVYATYMGAQGDHCDGGTSRFDPQGIVYQSVCTISSNQYQSPGCYQPSKLASGYDIASFKFNFELVGQAANIALTPNDSGCAPYAIQMNNVFVNPGMTYYWEFGDGDTSTAAAPLHTYTAPGVYTVTLIVQSPSGCIASDTSSAIITVLDSVKAAFNHSLMLGCVRDTLKTSLLFPTANTTYAWAFGDGGASAQTNATHYYNTQGIYTVSCTASNGVCASTSTVVINNNHPINAAFVSSANNKITDSVCIGTPFLLNAIASVPNGYITNYKWTWGDGGLYNGASDTTMHLYNQYGVFTMQLIVTDTLGCKDTTKQNVFVDGPQYTDFAFVNNNLCLGEPLLLDDSLSNVVKNFTWNFGDGVSIKNQHDPTHIYNVAGFYTVTLNAEYRICPPTSKSLVVEIGAFPNVLLPDDTTLCPGFTGPIPLSSPGTIAQKYLWSTGDTSKNIIAADPGLYWLKASNGSCISIDSTNIVRFCYIWIPNAFSPNGDGYNDYFLPAALLASGVQKYQMQIFNRWGEKMYLSANQTDLGWDGKLNGQPVDMGVYYYLIDVIDAKGNPQRYKGDFTLLK
jgi:gliding motility-associated-like protein